MTMRLQTLDLKTSSSALPRLGRRRNLGGHSWGFIPHCSQQCYKMFAQLSIERQMFWVNLREDSNLRCSNIGITCSTYCAEKTLWIDVYETKMAGRRSRGFKPQIYRCCSLIIYLVTFTNLAHLLFLFHTNNLLFVSWVCHGKVFQMQLLRCAI